MQVVTNAGALRLLSRALTGDVGGTQDLALRLFQNDFTPDADSIAADFTECTFGGYFRQWVDSAMWDTPAIVADKGRITYSVDPLTWTATSGGQTVYGWYVIEQSTGTVLWASRLETPRVITTGLVLELTLAFELASAP